MAEIAQSTLTALRNRHCENLTSNSRDFQNPRNIFPMPGWAKDGEQLIDFSNRIPWNILVNTSCFLSNVLCLIWWDYFSFYIHRSEIRPSGARMDSTTLQLNVSPQGCNWNKAELKQIGSTTVRCSPGTFGLLTSGTTEQWGHPCA